MKQILRIWKDGYTDEADVPHDLAETYGPITASGLDGNGTTFEERTCNFTPWEEGCCSGEIRPASDDYLANATIRWEW